MERDENIIRLRAERGTVPTTTTPANFKSIQLEIHETVKIAVFQEYLGGDWHVVRCAVNTEAEELAALTNEQALCVDLFRTVAALHPELNITRVKPASIIHFEQRNIEQRFVIIDCADHYWCYTNRLFYRSNQLKYPGHCLSKYSFPSTGPTSLTVGVEQLHNLINKTGVNQ